MIHKQLRVLVSGITAVVMLCAFSSLSAYSTPQTLKEILTEITEQYRGEIGIAVIYNDSVTVIVNNEKKYPMMSVFKLHQALATCKYLDSRDISLDSYVRILRTNLNPDTWSPMLKDFRDDTITISYRGLLSYALEQSDNNASNFLFEHIISPKQTDEYIASLIPRESFQIKYSEAEMLTNHSLAYENSSSPIGAAILINRLYNDATIASKPYAEYIRKTLQQCKTGTDRIVGPFLDKPGVIVGHKTGSGFRDNGILAAHNDVAHIQLPDGRHYTLAVFVKDFPGSEKSASEIIARISSIVYNFVEEINIAGSNDCR